MAINPRQDKTLKRQNLASMLVDDLRNRILSGELGGNTLLRQEQLAQEYGVSRMPVREALKQLDSEGLVVVENNRGAIVSELSKHEIEEIFDLRLMLELDLLSRSIPNITEAAIEKAQGILNELDRAYETQNIAHWGMLNAQFHMSLYEPANRPVSLSLASRLGIQADRYLRLQIVNTTDIMNGAVEHQMLLDLCKQQKADEALALLSTHIRRTKEQLMDIFSSHRI